jgi:hypothetical protein
MPIEKRLLGFATVEGWRHTLIAMPLLGTFCESVKSWFQ